MITQHPQSRLVVPVPPSKDGGNGGTGTTTQPGRCSREQLGNNSGTTLTSENTPNLFPTFTPPKPVPETPGTTPPAGNRFPTQKNSRSPRSGEQNRLHTATAHNTRTDENLNTSTTPGHPHHHPLENASTRSGSPTTDQEQPTMRPDETIRCGCGHTWTGKTAAHCGKCHHTFSTTALFDRHRTAEGEHGRCIPPDQIRTKQGNRLMYHRNGMWRGPELTNQQKTTIFPERHTA